MPSRAQFAEIRDLVESHTAILDAQIDILMVDVVGHHWTAQAYATYASTLPTSVAANLYARLMLALPPCQRAAWLDSILATHLRAVRETALTIVAACDREASS